MKQHLTATKLVLLLGVTAASICISGFREKESVKTKSFRTQHNSGDTTTPGQRNRNSDLELEKAMQQLDKEMQKLDEQIKKIDLTKVQKDIDASLNKIDFEKIGKEVQASLAKIDWNKIEVDVKDAMEKVKKVDMVKLQEEMKKVQEEMEKVKVEVNINAEKIKKDVGEAMEKAKVSIEKAKVEIELMNEFTDALEADKLIDKKKSYKIEIKEGELYINGTKQPKEVSDKFRKYIKKDNYSIQKGEGNRISI
jgi:chromosome segregation ATPase